MQFPGFANKTGFAFVNLGIRGVTQVARFVLLIFLAKERSPEDVSIYGLFLTTITLALYLVGLDFYTYSSRRILLVDVRERSPFLRDQLVFYGLNYLVFFPLLSIVFFTSVIPVQYILIFYILLFLEHIGQEFYRTYALFSKPVTANLLLFLRSGLWAYVLIFLYFIGWEDAMQLNTVFYAWTASGILTLIASVVLLKQFQFRSVRGIPINREWIKTGLRVSFLFFIGTAGYKIIDFADRYFVRFYKGEDQSAVYVTYALMCNIIETIVYTAVIIIYSPKLIELLHKDEKEYIHVQKVFSRQLILYTCVCTILLTAGIYPVLQYLHKDMYVDYFPVFVVLAVGKAVLNFSYIYHYILYARRIDRPIIVSTLICAVLNIILNFILIPAYGIMGAACATLISLVLLLALKWYYAKQFPETGGIFFTKRKEIIV